MTENLQSLIEKIQHDGVDKAKADAEDILRQARAKAHSSVEEAKVEAARIIAAARQEAESFERRAEETIRQCARDTVLTVEKSVTALLTTLLLKDLTAAMADPAFAAPLAAEAVRAYLRGSDTVEVAAADKLALALRARLAAEAVSGVSVVTDESTGSGFRVRLAGGRVEHSFTGPAVVEFLARPLRPRLAELLKSSRPDL
jgi:V/A-type H+-transporting ATPase subunit E